MSGFETTLGTIRCHTSKATVDDVLSTCGLRARAGNELHHFNIVSGSRESEPEVDSDLFELALARLHGAQRDGALPSWSVVARKGQQSV